LLHSKRGPAAPFLFELVRALCCSDCQAQGNAKIFARPLGPSTLTIIATVAIRWKADATRTRRFPPPWSVEVRAAAFVVCDANGEALAYVYFEEPGRRSAAKLLSKDGARRIAANRGSLATGPAAITRATGRAAIRCGARLARGDSFIFQLQMIVQFPHSRFFSNESL
jgi:hypothetical protein